MSYLIDLIDQYERLSTCCNQPGTSGENDEDDSECSVIIEENGTIFLRSQQIRYNLKSFIMGSVCESDATETATVHTHYKERSY
jgi:hypothetical protein